MSDNARADRGNEMRKTLFGTSPEPSELMKDIMDVTVEHLFGDIWTRDGMALRDRSLITCAALVALGRDQQLRVHLKGALNVGISREEIKEMMIHLAHYAGWPAAMVAMRAVDDVFTEMDAA